MKVEFSELDKLGGLKDAFVEVDVLNDKPDKLVEFSDKSAKMNENAELDTFDEAKDEFDTLHDLKDELRISCMI